MANGRRDWWNQGQPMPTEKLDTADIVTRLAQFGSQMAQLAETGKKNKRHHFLTMADAITKGFEAEFDNNKIQSSIAKLDKFYNDRADKHDLETQDAYKIYKDKMTAQLNENVEFDAKMKEWEGFSETSEQFVTDMYQYSSLNNDAEKLQFINNDFAYQDAIKNKELGPLVASKTNELEKYEAWQTNNMKNTISDYGAHVRNFGAKFYDRIPNSISMSMADTQFYMNDILKGWQKDGRVDDFEFQAWSGLIKNGDDQALQNLNSAKEEITSTQIKQANHTLLENVSTYNNNKNLLELGKMTVNRSEIESLFDGLVVPPHVATSSANEINVPLEWWKTQAQLNAIAKEKGEGSEEYLQALEKSRIAIKFWEPVELQQIQLQRDIEKGNEILNSFGIYDSLETSGYTGTLDKKQEQQNQQIEDMRKAIYKDSEKIRNLDKSEDNVKKTMEMANYIKSGYKNTNRLEWVKNITREGDIKTVRKGGRDRWYKEKLSIINGLIKQHGEGWAKAYNQGGYSDKWGALPISAEILYKEKNVNEGVLNELEQYIQSTLGGQ